ncbi:MAG: hypothetical protein AB1589_12895 [Cyanobacteriota bacterium]
MKHTLGYDTSTAKFTSAESKKRSLSTLPQLSQGERSLRGNQQIA